MKKWNCHFDGRGVYEILEQVRELQKAYQLSDQQILRGFPEFLRGDAQLWYRNCASTITSWQELEQGLISFYLSPGEQRRLDQQAPEPANFRSPGWGGGGGGNEPYIDCAPSYPHSTRTVYEEGLRTETGQFGWSDDSGHTRAAL